MSDITDVEKEFIRNAAAYLESPPFLVRAADLIGIPAEKGISLLPAPVRKSIARNSHAALMKAAKIAFSTLGPGEEASRWVHDGAVAATGAVGGFFGLPALALELPLTTTIILRAIGAIARECGEDLAQRQAQLECLLVFTMGAPSKSDDAMDSAYYTTRIAFADIVREAAAFLATRGTQEILDAVTKGSAPLLVRFLAQIASRFESVVLEKFMLQAVPVAGALAGSTINILFMEHFQTLARFHFGLKKLERLRGPEAIRAIYNAERRKN